MFLFDNRDSVINDRRDKMECKYFYNPCSSYASHCCQRTVLWKRKQNNCFIIIPRITYWNARRPTNKHKLYNFNISIQFRINLEILFLSIISQQLTCSPFRVFPRIFKFAAYAIANPRDTCVSWNLDEKIYEPIKIGKECQCGKRKRKYKCPYCYSILPLDVECTWNYFWYFTHITLV